MARRKRQSERRMDITPLIDCVFQLLIFFMVTTVFTTPETLQVDLPKAAESDKAPEKDLNILISEKGEMELNGELVTLDNLENALRQQKALYNSRVLIIKADEKALHGMVVDVMDAAKTVGIDELAIATEKEEGEQ